MKFSFSLLLLALSSSLIASEAKITGPDFAKPGDLVILDGSQSTGATSFAWRLMQHEKSMLPIDGGKRLVFASGEKGTYRFVLAVAAVDEAGNAVVSIAVHTLTIGEAPQPEPVVPPEPAPDGFRGAVTAAARSLNSSARSSAKSVANIYDQVAASAESNPTAYAPADMVAEVKSSLAAKLSARQISDWKDFWPQIAQAFVELKLAADDTAGHVKAFRIVAEVLSKSD